MKNHQSGGNKKTTEEQEEEEKGDEEDDDDPAVQAMMEAYFQMSSNLGRIAQEIKSIVEDVFPEDIYAGGWEGDEDE